MSNAEIDLPGLRETLWHRMRDDLKLYMPDIGQTKLLKCPACGRFLPQDDFDLEHIIPRQVLKDDPPSVKDAIPVIQRSGATLLCTRPLLIKGKLVHGRGCNSWKGKFFDGALRELFNGRALRSGNILHARVCLCSAWAIWRCT